MGPAIVAEANVSISPEADETQWTRGQRESMSKLDMDIDLNNRFTEDLTVGFEPKYREDPLAEADEMKSNGKKSSVMSEEDPWAIKELASTSTPWRELTGKQKVKRVVFSIGKLLAVITLLYFFVCSLDLLSLGFRILGGRTTGDIFQQSEILQNPVVGVMIGILTTVLVQSSSTSTSIIVSMVSASFLTVEIAIPIIMGANIGTSITNTIVSLTQAGDRNQFRRAFAGATVHDMFNWLTVIVLLIVEVTTHYLLHLTTWVMDQISQDSTSGGEIELLGAITKPFVNLIVQIDKSVLECWSTPNCTDADDASLIKEMCDVKGKSAKVIRLAQSFVDNVAEAIASTELPIKPKAGEKEECTFLFARFNLSDAAAGAIILVCSLIVLCSCLILIVKVLQSVMRGQIATVIKTTLNAKIPYVPWITGYIALAVGALMTFLVQSSSVFTSALTPLVGLGVISVQRVYPLTLGSNIGTTTTALLASMAVEGDQFRPSMQIALCHLFFNITGILIFYPIPFMRFPIGMAKFLGDTTAKYRWFAIAYMILMFVVLPVITMGLSFAGPIYVIIFAAIVFILFATVLIVNLIRQRKPQWLPEFLQSWKFLPIYFRSLEPYDRIFTSWSCCKKLKQDTKEAHEDAATEFDNAGFEPESGRRMSSRNNLSMVSIEGQGRKGSNRGTDNPGYVN